eukprot:910811-Lingulodinium_polyedra.AAC.1
MKKSLVDFSERQIRLLVVAAMAELVSRGWQAAAATGKQQPFGWWGESGPSRRGSEARDES